MLRRGANLPCVDSNVIWNLFSSFSYLTQPSRLHSKITVKGHELDSLLLQVLRVKGVVGDAMNTLGLAPNGTAAVANTFSLLNLASLLAKLYIQWVLNHNNRRHRRGGGGRIAILARAAAGGLEEGSAVVHK